MAADLKTKLKGFPKITALTATDEGVFIKFTPVKLAEKYDIRRADTQFGDYEHIGWATSNTEYTDTTAEKNKTYWYKIVARKSLENKKLSKKASVTKPCVISDIKAPQNLEASVNGGTVTLKWDKGDADFFAVYKKSDLYERQLYLGTTDKNTFSDENAVSGRGYYYTVQSFKNQGVETLSGNFGGECLAVLLDKGEIISVKALLRKKVEISARLISGCDGYIFERSEKENGEFTEVGRTADITENTFTDKVPSSLKTYYYRVKAYKIVDNREFTNEGTQIKSVSSK